ncbi:MAG TPA: aldolase/citrate lyase family protein [Solirubrobacteraceae bacterium]|jgi:4-hydroxy-2-oxoheptanedioate aldolase
MSVSEAWSIATTTERLRARWRLGRPTFGAWAALGSSYVVEVLTRVGFDWIGIDLQHGLALEGQVVGLLQAAAITQTPALVRVAGHSSEGILRALDAGANGVIVPMVNSAEDAAAVAAACVYPPAGERSWGPARPQLGMPSYSATTANAAVVCAVMVETRAAVESIDAIVAVAGVEAIFVGPTDLSLSYGAALDAVGAQEAMSAAILEVRLACERAGVVPGIYAGSPSEALRWAGAGFRLIAVTSDVSMVRASALDAFAALGDAPGPNSQATGN